MLRLTGTLLSVPDPGGYVIASATSGTFFARMLSVLDPASTAFAAPAPQVDKIVAIPLWAGSLMGGSMLYSKTATINSNGTFTLFLDNQSDWLLVLIDSNALADQRFVGSLAVTTSAGMNESLLNLPATLATVNVIDLGSISKDAASNDAVTSGTIGSTQFALTADQLLSMAKTDDVFKNAKNLINNYDTSTMVWYQLRPDFAWYGPGPDFTSLKNAYSGPEYLFNNYNFQLDTNSRSVSIFNVCGQAPAPKKILQLYPPVDIDVGGVTYGPPLGANNPMQNDTSACQQYNPAPGVTAWEAWEPAAGDFYASDAYENISYSFPVWFTGSIPSGSWIWREELVNVATFDASVASPVDTANPLHPNNAKGFIPSLRLNVDGSNNITSVDVSWWFFDHEQGAYVMVYGANLQVLEMLLPRAELILENNDLASRRHDSIGFDPSKQSRIDLSSYGWIYVAGGASATNELASMGVFYENGGIGRFFFHNNR